ncbi:MAG: GAF domain-containing protein [Chloroflexi bacterium]|nr:GAF domain-containing protein [Chloroflexota bacterium]
MQKQLPFEPNSPKRDSPIVPLESADALRERQILQREYLLHISREITAALDLPTLLHRVLRYAVEILAGQAGIIALRRADGTFFVHTSVGLPSDALSTLEPFLKRLPQTVEQGEATNWQFTDVREPLAGVSQATGLGLSHAVGLPLLLGDQFLGMVFVFRTTGAALFSNIDKVLLQAFADQAAIAIDNARLYSQMTSRANALSKLYQAGLALAEQGTDLDATLRQVVRLAKDAVEADGAAILMRENGRFTVSVAEGVLDNDDIRRKLADPSLTEPLSQCEPWVIKDVAEEPALAPLAAHDIKTGVCVPIAVGDEHSGSMLVVTRDKYAFHSQDIALLNAFANQSALAIRNARLYHDLSVQHERLSAILANSADGILILDAAQRVQDFNQAIARMTGWNRQEAAGQPGDTIIRLTSPQGAAVPMPRLNGERATAEGYLARRDGTRGPYVSISLSPLRDAQGQTIGAVMNVHDLSAFREAEELKSTFLSVISHELKTPVALIKGFAETLSREDATPDAQTVREFGHIIADESDRLTRLIDNLLTAARVEAGGISLSPVPEVPLDKLAEQAAAAFREQTDRHQIDVEFPPDFPLITADPHWLRQVLDNLLSNAIKYSPNGGRIVIKGWYDEANVHVSVSDEGLGLSQEEQQRIFTRFYRAPDKKRISKGAGLGLYLCKAVVEAHGGQISVRSEEGKGTTFAFTLPRQSRTLTQETAHE